MKALLIGINTKYIHPAMSLYQLKLNCNYDCLVLEFTIKEETSVIFGKINEELLKEHYDLICFSCYLWNVEKVLSLSKMVKQNFPIKLLVGGPEVSYDAKYFLMTYPSIDFISRGEGEDCLNQLLEYLEGKREIQNVCNLSYMNNNIFVENPLEICDLSKIKLATLMVKDLKNQVVYLESSRGCPFHCSYCTASLDNKVRYFPLNEVLDILDELMKRKASTVKFLDRTFNANKKYMLSVLNFINKHNICTTFQFEIVIDILDYDVINFIAALDRKFLRFEVGIQTTNQDVNKNVFRKQNMIRLKENILKLNATNNVDIHVDLIAGLPGETIHSFINSFNETFFLRCKEVQLGFLKFLRGTKLLESVDTYNCVYSKTPPYEIISNSTMSSFDLDQIRLVEKSLNYYYNSGKFKRTFDYLLDNNLIDNPFNFFKNLSKDIISKNMYDLFIHLNSFFKANFTGNFKSLHYLLIIDYLTNHLTKPKKWWKENLTKELRKELYPKIVTQIPFLTLADLYQYSIIVLNENKCFIIIYKNFNPSSYEIYL